MEKEGQEAKFTNSPGKEKKRGKLPDFFLSFQLDRRGKWTWRTVTVCVLYLLKRSNTWLNLFHLIPPPRSSFVCASLSPDPFCSTAVSSILPTHPLPIQSCLSGVTLSLLRVKCKLSDTRRISQVRHVIGTLHGAFLLLLSSFD